MLLVYTTTHVGGWRNYSKLFLLFFFFHTFFVKIFCAARGACCRHPRRWGPRAGVAVVAGPPAVATAGDFVRRRQRIQRTPRRLEFEGVTNLSGSPRPRGTGARLPRRRRGASRKPPAPHPAPPTSTPPRALPKLWCCLRRRRRRRLRSRRRRRRHDLQRTASWHRGACG